MICYHRVLLSILTVKWATNLDISDTPASKYELKIFCSFTNSKFDLIFEPLAPMPQSFYMKMSIGVVYYIYINNFLNFFASFSVSKTYSNIHLHSLHPQNHHQPITPQSFQPQTTLILIKIPMLTNPMICDITKIDRALLQPWHLETLELLSIHTLKLRGVIPNEQSFPRRSISWLYGWDKQLTLPRRRHNRLIRPHPRSLWIWRNQYLPVRQAETRVGWIYVT